MILAESTTDFPPSFLASTTKDGKDNRGVTPSSGNFIHAGNLSFDKRSVRRTHWLLAFRYQLPLLMSIASD